MQVGILVVPAVDGPDIDNSGSENRRGALGAVHAVSDQRVNYFQGVMDGLNDTGGWGTNGNLVFHIDRKSISSTLDVITEFEVKYYINSNSLAKGKPAWKILQIVLVNNHSAEFVPMQRQTLATETVQ